MVEKNGGKDFEISIALELKRCWVLDEVGEGAIHAQSPGRLVWVGCNSALWVR